MSDNSRIEWTNATWGPVIGCTRVSPGCDHCYAEGQVNRRHAAGLAVGGKLLDAFPARFDTVSLRPQFLGLPLRWRRPRRVFVNSLADLFHDDVPDDYIAQVWAVMSMTPQHTYQVLTKRHARMRSLLSSAMFRLAVNASRLERGVSVLPDSRRPDGTYAWPLRNVHLGVSAEDQQWADIRIPALLATPAAVRWVSAEPLLGQLSLMRWLRPDDGMAGICFDIDNQPWHPRGGGKLGPCTLCRPGLDWVVVGGESGAGARPLDVRWVSRIVGDCVAEGVPVFVKQLGSVWAREHGLRGKADVPAAWPEQLRVRQYPDLMRSGR